MPVAQEEKRRHQRRLVGLVARIRVSPDDPGQECVVSEISASGARLVAWQTVPSEFRLFLADGTCKDCFVRWRNSRQLGVEFLSPAAAPLVWNDELRKKGEPGKASATIVKFQAKRSADNEAEKK